MILYTRVLLRVLDSRLGRVFEVSPYLLEFPVEHSRSYSSNTLYSGIDESVYPIFVQSI